MEREHLARTIRKSPEQVTAGIVGIDNLHIVQSKIECALMEEWWRGFYAGVDAAGVRPIGAKLFAECVSQLDGK